MQLAVVLLCAKSGLAQVTIPFFKPGAIRVLIFSGRNNHDWRTTTPFLRKTLVQSGRFDVRVEEEPMGITEATLAAYDVLVLDYDGPRWGEVTEKAVEDFVKAGKGLVGIHAASYAFTGLEVLGDNHRGMGFKEPPWPEYLKMLGGWWTEGRSAPFLAASQSCGGQHREQSRPYRMEPTESGNSKSRLNMRTLALRRV
jgi:hypothetical protein